jgi:NAD(P)H-hydrate epimerase
MGAAVLASRAALRTGAGLLTIHAPSGGYTVLQSAVPEAMVSADTNAQFFSAVPDTGKYSAIGLGPGLGQHPATVEAVRKLLGVYRKPMVVDADALNILSAHPDLLELVPPQSVLTPHPKEFERLAGKWKNDFERLEKLRGLASKLQVIIVLKGAYSSICLPTGKVYFNPTGNPGMATGGTGDVLTGVIAGLLAQSYAPEDAAMLGVYLHGLSGDLASVEKGVHSLIASDVIEYLPSAYKKVTRG